MKRARFTEEQIIGVLREHEAGAKTAELARKHGVSEATLYNWKAKFGGMDVSEAKRLRQLEDENAKLKSCWPSRCWMPRRCVSFCQKNGRARRQARGCRASAGRTGPRERRACSIVSADRKMARYRSCRPPDSELRVQLRELANARRRFGYRRLFVLLRQRGEPSGLNRIYRLYREEGLSVRKRRARRRAVGTRAPILVEARRMPAGRWILFMTSSPMVAVSGSEYRR